MADMTVEQALEVFQHRIDMCATEDCCFCKVEVPALATLRAEIERLEAVKAALDKWSDAYAAFKGAFDTPAEWRRRGDEFANDARCRMREINEAIDAAKGASHEP